MKINSITLVNFGSYEGTTKFDTHVTADGRNIVLVGGKNGAGKTTLFTAMRLCLYGYMSMGYKNINSFYNRAVTKLINNTAKLIRPACARVEMEIALSNGREEEIYTLKRVWFLTDTLSETFTVWKDNEPMSSAEVADFEKYLLSIIPPELFNLYFFDGEKIADFFMEEGGNSRIKEAFLTLCGYDTFEIMRKNFKRISTGSTKSSLALGEYLSAKDSVEGEQKAYQDLAARLEQCIDDIDTCEADLTALEKDYNQKGGVTQEEWDQKLFTLKEEEKKRETYNGLLKKWANDIVPFLMVRDQIVALKNQIGKETNEQKYRYFCEVLTHPSVKRLLTGSVDAIKTEAAKQFGDSESRILDLSLEQSASLLAQISKILDFETTKVEKCKRAIKQSLAITAKTRSELENSNISNVQEYMQKRAQLFELKSALLVQRLELEQQCAEQNEKLQQAELQLTRVQAKLEEELKQASIGDISARAIVMLDKLQHTLYRKQIQKVESFFRKEIKSLMRKTKFIDDIRIDDDFTSHIYREEEFEQGKLVEILEETNETQITTSLGTAAIKKLKKIYGVNSLKDVAEEIRKEENQSICLPVEIDKTSLSNGEKQIFIMALYHSLVQLCSHEIPFIIDTPFARIDTEHRRNISKHFFSKLNGQVFILSTNEEINSAHVQILNDKIAATYLLENTDNKRTVVVSGEYFEV